MEEKKSTYTLYGTCLISDDSTLANFAMSVEQLIQDQEEIDDDSYMDIVDEVLIHDISRTDINYEKLMKRYAPEIGELLYEISNRGMPTVYIRFFGKSAENSFNQLVRAKIEINRANKALDYLENKKA